MGKRKERRLAAKIGAGRRVKLDLFAEPSGDLGGSSDKDEDGKDVNSKLDQELPISPSSSGPPPGNPLSLLGQYSDEELDDGSNEAASNSDDDKQAKISAVEPVEEGEIVDIEDHSSQKAYNQDVERDSASVSDSLIAEADAGRSKISLDEKDHEANIENQNHVPVAADAKTTEGMSSTWKMVLHEETNRYYYWNTVTGETSWDLPESLAQQAALANELEALGTEMRVPAAGDVNAPAAFGVNLDDFSANQGVGYSELPDMKAIYEPGALVNQSLEPSGVDGNQFLGGFSVVGALPYEDASLGNHSFSVQVNATGGNSAAGSCEGYDQSALTKEQGAVELPSRLVQNGEALLEKLKLLQGSVVDSVEHNRYFKYMLEIEIRLSDIRCLLPYGLSLVPFWMHSEGQFHRLETAINSEFGNQDTKVNELHLSTEGKEVNSDAVGDAKVDANMSKSSPVNLDGTLHGAHTAETALKSAHEEASDESISNVEQTYLQDLSVRLHSGSKDDKRIDEAAVHKKESPNSELQLSEDVDMDIDMEVEDQSPSMKKIVDIGGQLPALSGQVVPPSAPIAGISVTPESELIIPPPPQEEWIPPPPPDEGIPPPPPDEPPESLCPPPPPSEPEPVPSIYTEQQIYTYVEPSVNYYGNTITQSLSTSYYEHADVSQVAALTPPAYYVAVSNAQPTAVLNPVDSAAYYVIPNGALPVVPVPATIGSSSFQASSGHQTYDPLSIEQAGVVDAVAKASSFLEPVVDPLDASVKTDIAPTQVPSTFVASASATLSTKEYASAPSCSASATSAAVTGIPAAVPDASAAVSKVQSKASRMKRPKVAVASSLRSNKKVSSLVDKWKAAKEELQEEEEEEPETHLEILEKKRQREIEGWRAQQIASGEAKENANFQPLGGDWRERVKRRRAQKEAAAGRTSDIADNGKKQPQLSELPKDLPPGWQAYWDESSSQIYYANSITSETTWTRPTR